MSESDTPFFFFPAGEEDDPISFFAEDVDFEPDQARELFQWIKAVIEAEQCKLGNVSFIFCSDNHLLDMNQNYLQHDTLTDIITFPYADPPLVHGDIFISIDRVKDNAATYKVSFEQELHRVMIHGILHLCGFGDKSADEKNKITAKEDAALAKRKDYLRTLN
jgi:probable rRNA maturation factor